MGITEFLALYITKFIEETGYVTVFIGMTMESMVFPVPSEAIMPFAGFLIAEGKFTFFGVVFFSTLGSIVGSLLSYAMGRYGGEIFVEKYGRYFLLDKSELKATERFFSKYGQVTIFVSRFIPVIRHLISIPAGAAKMNIWSFSILTIIGAGMWNAFLAWTGFYLKQNWQLVMDYSHIVDLVVVGILALLVALFIYRHFRKKRSAAA
jgi:membrane protein DedA with SNARE-associated domain